MIWLAPPSLHFSSTITSGEGALSVLKPNCSEAVWFKCCLLNWSLFTWLKKKIWNKKTFHHLKLFNCVKIKIYATIHSILNQWWYYLYTVSTKQIPVTNILINYHCKRVLSVWNQIQQQVIFQSLGKSYLVSCRNCRGKL